LLIVFQGYERVDTAEKSSELLPYPARDKNVPIILQHKKWHMRIMGVGKYAMLSSAFEHTTEAT
jgi:hypothetical protein